MYSNDLESLLQLLTGRNGMLYLEPSRDAETIEPWHASLLLAEGRVITCDLRNEANDRILLSGVQAITWLANVGSLSWRLEEPFHALRQLANPSTLPIQHMRQYESLIPKRTVEGGQTMMISWSRRQRQVFALVDGMRSVEKIAALLRYPPELVEEVLNELQALGVIQTM